MGGAYTAAPAVTVPSTSPPGWGIWPFPGPLPPGYTPDYSLIGTAPETMTPGSSVTGIKFILVDHGEYATGEPIGDIVYTATMEGNSVGLKFAD